MELKLIKVQIEKDMIIVLVLSDELHCFAVAGFKIMYNYINYDVSNRIDKGWVRGLGDGLSICYVPYEYL